MFVKICGLTDVKTALAAVESGADFIGLLFSKVSPRAIPLEKAKEIAQAVKKAGAEPVGVFADEKAEEILKIVNELDLKFVQLHGTEPRFACGSLPKELHVIYVADGKPIPKFLDPKKDYLLFENHFEDPKDFRFFIAGKLQPETVRGAIEQFKPHGVDVSSGVEREPGKKDPARVESFLRAAKPERYGLYGGMYVPELLMAPFQELAKAFETIVKSEPFQKEFLALLKDYAGRPTALTEIPRFAEAVQGPRIFLKREDLLHTGAHKINNAIGQCLLAKKLGKQRIIAETGAGQHGVATATACALLGLPCVIYMGQVDIDRQGPNVAKMKLLGAEVKAVPDGTLKDAVNEALRDYAASYETTHYCLGSALGPYPFPAMVAEFQKIIGIEARAQMQERIGRDPDLAIACVGGGSNAIGLFGAFLESGVQLVGVEAGGEGPGKNAARFQEGSPGVLHGCYTFVLQDEQGQIAETHSISAGLDYPSVGPQHADLRQKKRARYEACTDEEALNAFRLLSRTEGIIPAFESSHALGYLIRIAPSLPKDAIVLVNLSGRGDKDLPTYFEKYHV